jgi:dihydroorotase-like cyclic amidohydrolase
VWVRVRVCVRVYACACVYVCVCVSLSVCSGGSHTKPKHFAWSKPPLVEREAVSRAIALAELVDCPIQIFHVTAVGDSYFMFLRSVTHIPCFCGR